MASSHPSDAAVPAPQAVPLLSGAPALAERAAGVLMEPCWAVMVDFDAPVPLPLDGVFVHGSALSWAARDGSKPGRPPGERWVLHATSEFSREAVAHRWRYARAEPALTQGALFDEVTRLGACGDWCAGSRVEGAFLSGMALSRRLAVLER